MELYWGQPGWKTNFGWGKYRRHLDGKRSFNLRWFVVIW